MTNVHPPIYQHPELDGTAFFLEGDTNKNAGMLFVHGFTATTVEVRQIASFFYKQGFTVAAPLLPGHGTTPADMNKKRMNDWIAAVENTYQELSKRVSNIYVFGESMGALLSLNLASTHSEVKKLFLFSPALRIDGLWQSLFIWPFIQYVFKKNTDGQMLWQGYNVVPLRAGAQLFKLQKKTKKLLKFIKTDCAIFQGKKDKTINPLGTIETYNLLGSENKELIWLEESSHCILLDKELPTVLQMCKNKLTGE